MTVAPSVRFDRLLGTRTLAGDAHRRWIEARIVVVGAGLLGGAFVREAARSGASCDVYDPALGRDVNQGTQDVDLGLPKAEVVARRCDAFAPGAVRPHVTDVRHVGVGCFESADLLVDCTDDPGLARLLTEISNGWGLPLLRLAVDGSGERELGRVLVSDGGAGGACQLCAASWRDVFDAGPATPCLGERGNVVATYAGSALGMAVAGVGLLSAQRIVGGRGADLVRDREVLLDLDGLRILPMQLQRNDRCLSGHRSWDPVRLGRPASDTTVRDLVVAATDALVRLDPADRRPSVEEGVRVAAPGHPIQPSVMCPTCSHADEDVGTALRPAPVCPCCGEAMLRRRDISFDEVTLVQAEALGVADQSCSSLGLPARGTLVRARVPERSTVHLLFP